MLVDRSPSFDPPLRDRVALWLATGLGVGLVTPAPGTIGGLWGLLLVPAIALAPNIAVQAAVIAGLVALAAVVCGAAARALDASHDPASVVLDEIVVLPIVFLGAPPITASLLFTGWALFRLFDIWKPGPVGAVEKLPDGWGIVADDVAAATIAWAALQGLLWLDRATGVAWLTP